MPTEALHDTLPSEYGLDGLIDEVRIYKTALSGKPGGGVLQELPSRPGGRRLARHAEAGAFPSPTTGGEFKAVYTHLPYYETWENMWRFGQYPDVVVGFDRLPVKYVFWRGVSYIPDDRQREEPVVHQRVQRDERSPMPRATTNRCPTKDAGIPTSGSSRTRPARAVVHWRCWLSNPDHHWANYNAATGWGDIADWYYYIYPDGVAVKRMRCYTSQPDGWYEWQETIAVLGEGQHPESVLAKSPVLTLVDAAGKAADYDWNPEPPKPDFRGKIIHLIHYTGRYSPFTIQRFTGGDIYSGERNWYSVFPSWNHWPTAQANSSGRNACFPDRAAHSSVIPSLLDLEPTAAGRRAVPGKDAHGRHDGPGRRRHWSGWPSRGCRRRRWKPFPIAAVRATTVATGLRACRHRRRAAVPHRGVRRTTDRQSLLRREELELRRRGGAGDRFPAAARRRQVPAGHRPRSQRAAIAGSVARMQLHKSANIPAARCPSGAIRSRGSILTTCELT